MAPNSTEPLKLNKKTFDQINLGETVFFVRTITAADMAAFQQLTGDANPLHTDESYAAETEFGGRVVYGMLLGSFFSALVGMLLPGLHALYFSQTLEFRQAVKIGQTVTVKGTVTAKYEAARMIELKTEILDEQGRVAVSGTAKVKVRE